MTGIHKLFVREPLAAYLSAAMREVTKQTTLALARAAMGVVDKTLLDAGQLQGAKNRLINGAFAHNERGAGAGAADATYGFDRWRTLTQTGTITLSQLTDAENGSPTAIRLTQAQVTAQRMGLYQPVESLFCRDLRGRNAVLCGRVRCSASTNIRYAIVEFAGTADAPPSDPVLDWTSVSYIGGGFFVAANIGVLATGVVACTANTWRDLTAITGLVGNGATNLLVVLWTETAQAQNVTLDFARLQLEPGSVATPFETRAPADELARCQRFWHSRTIAATGGWYSASACALALAHPVKMRAAPTATILVTNPTVSEPGVSDRVASGATLINTVLTSGGAKFDLTGFSGATANRPAILFTDNIIAFSAEI